MAKIRDGSTYLGNHLTANDYYAEGESVTGNWQGRLAETWGLSGQAISAGDHVFERLRAGLTVDGSEPLRQRMRNSRDGSGAVCFFDFQVAAHKSVSVASLFDPRLVAAHDRAAAESFRELEAFAARRINDKTAGPGNWLETTGQLCAAVFRHDASRELDPQLHTHHVVANVTVGTDGKRYALTERQMVEAIRFAGKCYQNALARECLGLGYTTRETRNPKGEIEGFSLGHVSEKICERFSQRRAQIDAGIDDFTAKRGRAPTAAERSVITRETRSKKMSEISSAEVRQHQLARLSVNERADLQVATERARSLPTPTQPPASEPELVTHALDHLFERASVATGHTVLAEALNGALGRANLPTIRTALEKQAVRLSDESVDRAQFTTRENLEREQWSVRFVNDTRATLKPLREEVKTTAEFECLSEEQREAVRFLCATKDRVVSVRGVAGAGKTTMLQEVERQIGPITSTLYLAPTRGAVETLQKEGFTAATTISDYLIRSENGKEPAAWRGAFIVIDEAGLQSTRQGSDVLRLAQLHNNRIAFVGDAKQHNSVEAGDFSRMLEACSKMDRRELVSIRRQQHEDYRVAVSAMQRGEHAAGIEQLDRLGWVKEAGPDYLAKAADAYLERQKNGEKTLLVAPTWEENRVLTDRVRTALQARGHLSNSRKLEIEESLNWTKAERSRASRYEVGQVIRFNQEGAGGPRGAASTVAAVREGRVILKNGSDLDLSQAAAFEVFVRNTREFAEGDRILLRANDKQKNLTNGAILTIDKIDSSGAIRTKEGQMLPPGFRRFVHGYAVTSHRSQGTTCDHVIVAANRLDAKAAYVATSRGRKSCEIYTADKQVLMDGLARSGERVSALEVVRNGREKRQREAAAAVYGTRAGAASRVVSAAAAKRTSARR